MSASDLGRWEPLSLTTTVDMFSAAPFRWWISGGHALELHLGRSWRDHGDIDVGMLRSDAVALTSLLAGWDIRIAAAGRLAPWAGGALDSEASLHQNNLWCRHNADGPWLLDVTIGGGNDDEWIYRRNPRHRLPWAAAILRTTEGVPYLAPDLQLLFKARDPRDKDEHDASVVIPELDREQRQRLGRLLPGAHPWQRLIARQALDLLVVAIEDPRADDVRALLAEHLAFARRTTPPEDVHALDLAGLLDPAVTFLSARLGGELVGIGALKQLDGSSAEVKSMHTAAATRGRGVGRAVLDQLLAVAAERGCQRVSLETGSIHPFAPARSLYAGAGFVECGPFANYAPSPASTYMTISLDPHLVPPRK